MPVGMELHELHVLKRQAGACRHAAAVAGAGMRRGCGEIGATVAAGGQHHHLGRKAMDGAVVEIPGHDAGAGSVRLHDQVEREIFDEELRVVPERLAVERMQDGVAGAVGGGAGALHGRAVAVVHHVAAERPLVDLALFGAREGHAIMLELVDRGRRFTHHVFHGVHIAQPVRTLDGVVKVPLPAVRPHVGQRGGDAALRRDGVRAGWKHLGDAGRLAGPARPCRAWRADLRRRLRQLPRRICGRHRCKRCSRSRPSSRRSSTFRPRVSLRMPA